VPTNHLLLYVLQRVYRIWSGGVDSLDAALQLLLIVDYIVDWARDVYREAVIESLRKLAFNDSKSLAYDSDILSLAENAPRFWTIGADDGAGSAEAETQSEPHDALRAFDSRYGVVRDARYIRSRFISLYVTEDNFRVLMDSTASQEESAKLSKSILDILKEAWRVSREALDGLEAEWTGKDRDGSDLYPPDKKFLVVITAAAYLTPEWEQTREVSFLAVAETLLDPLLAIARLARRPDQDLDDFPSVQTDSILFFRALFQTTAEQNLQATVSRACVVTGVSPRRAGRGNVEYHRVAVCERTVDGTKMRLDVVIKPVALSKARELVYFMYEKHKVGRNEPSSSLFRISSRLDELGLPRQVAERPEVQHSPAFWPQTLPPETPGAPVLPKFSGHPTVVAISDEPGTETELCLFIMDPAIISDGLQQSKLLQSSPEWHFRVKRFDGRSACSRVWNVENPFSFDRRVLMPAFGKFVEYLLKGKHYGLPTDVDGPKSSQQSRSVWGPKAAGTTWTILAERFHLLDAFDFADEAPHRRRTRAIVWRNSLPRLRRIHRDSVVEYGGVGSGPLVSVRDDEGAQVARLGMGEVKQPLPGDDTAPKQQVSPGSGDGIDGDEVEKGNGLPAVGVERASSEQVAIDLTGDDQEGAVASKSKGKRPLRVTSSEAESSEMGARKRRRLKGGTNFDSDFIEDEELERLLEEGAFD
jgi:hypothetical protein